MVGPVRLKIKAMKKKIIAILTAPLERLYLFRIDRLFLLPSECRRLMEAHSIMVQKEFKYRREAFTEAVLELVQIRSKRTSTQYEVKIFVNRAALETKAGENAAVADISLAIAKQLVERHQKTKAAEEQRKKQVTKIDIKKTTATAILFLSLIISGCTSQNLIHGIPNLKQVDPGVWRGGQPNSEGWAWLKSQGVIFDVKLNTESEASDALAETNGLHICRFPITFEQQTTGEPRPGQIIGAVSCMSVGDVFVHCEHGQDRTGLIVGAYRIILDHWSKDAAYREMLADGFHPILRGLVRSWEKEK